MSIEVQNVSRDYVLRGRKEPVAALREVDLTVDAGQFVGVLGPNGAGKTTLVRILSTLLTPSVGTVRLFGCDVVRDPTTARRLIGVAFGGERGHYDRLSARDNLRFAAELCGVPRSLQRARVAEVLELVDLADRASDRVETFSRGMKQRLHIARSLVHRPRVLFLDEPSTGLDPVAARSLRALISELKDEGVTMIMTTHDMREAEELCDRVALLIRGRVRAEGSATEVKRLAGLGTVIDLEVRGHAQEFVDALRTSAAVERVTHIGGAGGEQVQVHVADDKQLPLTEVLALSRNVQVLAARERQASLEDAYVSIVTGEG